VNLLLREPLAPCHPPADAHSSVRLPPARLC
jgi:hypothetical protein